VSELDARGHLSGLLRRVQSRQDAVTQQLEVMTSSRLHAQNCLLEQAILFSHRNTARIQTLEDAGI
jgi:hypothetical protein